MCESICAITVSFFRRPNVKFFCGLNYDPFLYMEEHDKVYSAFVRALFWLLT
jgi:alpha 1,2-mannosyltransferase